MLNFSSALPDEICAELAARVRARRLFLNHCVDDFAAGIGVSGKTLGNFERTGRCHLDTFVRILMAFNATSELAAMLLPPQTPLAGNAGMIPSAPPRKRASSKPVKVESSNVSGR